MGLEDLISDNSVRRAIDISYTEGDLPHDVIRDPMFTIPAISGVLELDPDAASHAEDSAKRPHIANALNRLIAAQIISKVPYLEKEDYGDGGGWTREKRDLGERIAELQQQAATDISFVIGAESASAYDNPPAFIVVS
jgi:hypothetical protein